MTVQISQTTLNPPLQVADSDEVFLRAWYTNNFVAGDGVTGVQGGNGQSGFYYSIACSRNGQGNVVIPAFDVQETTLSNPTAGFFGQLFINGSPSRMVFGTPEATAGWQIPTAYGSVVGFDELARYNATVQILYAPNTFFTANQTIAEIQRLAAGVQTYAGVGILGLTQLSFAPDSPSAPIALGENDPRVNTDLTENTVPRVGPDNTLLDGLPTDDGTDWEIQTENYVRFGDFALNEGGTRFILNDTFATAQLLAARDAGASYAGVVASALGADPASVQVQATGYVYLINTAQGVLVLGDGAGVNNGTRIVIDDVSELIKLVNLPTSDPTTADALWNDAGTLKISAG